jgi:hypothetical protein
VQRQAQKRVYSIEETNSIMALASCPILVTEWLISTRLQGLVKNTAACGQYLDLSTQS